ncbi:MAG: ABC transporter permease subunit [Phycisphaerales bacterium]|nr:ABC transporter permease subunit [Phycisphaerales bacterium]
MRTHALFSIFIRNFKSYFASPIGYVFICAFVLLTAVAAFWPNEFFNTNLANLDQLNAKLPWIMLVFIPAITMSVWAEERRQGTDELLLTMPATDFEVVLGKYLAALAIFIVSLLFSLSNLVVLEGLGNPDLGLLAANYVGYGMTGAAMLSVGMVASFLTGNLTVGFVLGVAFNAPLVFAGAADAIIPWDGLARFVAQLGVVAHFDDPARGLLTLTSVVYFLSIVVVMLYLCMVLIGRRHWVVRSAGAPMSAHYGVRTLALVAIAIGVNALAHRLDVRLDLTSERLSSVSAQTEALIEQLDPDRPVFVDAYISPAVPERYVQTRLNLLSTLRSISALGGDAVVVRVNDTDRFSREAAEAEELFGITAEPVPASTGGRFSIDEIYLGLAVMSGLDKVVVPFFDRGIPVEYELVRSIATVSQQTRRRLGVLTTDASLFGGFDMQTMSARADQPIITELRKQYDVVQVDPAQPLTERYDVLLAVQPSSLSPPAMTNFIDAVRRGQPTAIFEDPFPFLDPSVPGTAEPKRPANSNPFMQQPPPEPKGDITPLWELLGVRFDPNVIVWDDYNPYPKMQEFYPEFVFIGDGGGADAFDREHPVTSGLQQVLTLFATALAPAAGSELSFTPLLRTGVESGYVAYQDLLQRSMFGRTSINPRRRHVKTGDSYVLAARIRTDETQDTPAGDHDTLTRDQPNVTLVADIDLLQSAFFVVRATGQDPDAPVSFDFDNVTFVLNLLDELAGDDRFVPIRSRRPRHRTLTAVERRTETAKAQANEQSRLFLDAFEEQRSEAERSLNEELARLQERPDADAREVALEVAMMTQVGQNRLQGQIETLERDRDRELERIERDLALQVRQVQDTYKLAAVGLPPIPPLLVGIVVYLRRRTLERIGVPAARLRGTGGRIA